MENKVNWMQQGWECPKCGAVMSPHTNCCVNCRGNTNIFVTGTTIGDPPSTADVPPYSNTTTCTPSSDEWWKKVQLNDYKAESKEDPEEQWERYYMNV